MKTNQNKSMNLQDLTHKLKYEDQRYARITKSFQVMYWILIPVYIALSVLHYVDGGRLSMVFGNLCFMVSMLIFAIFFRYFYRDYADIDYSLPTIEMLKRAVYRYRPYQHKKLWLIVPIVLMDLGLSFHDSEYASSGYMHLIYWGMMSLGVIIGLIIWWVRYKPLCDSAKQLIREIETNH